MGCFWEWVTINVSADAQKQYTLGDEFNNQEIISALVGGSVKF